eukprot:SAG31_NODE_5361_length_2588_cov_6.961029_2_plen_192_part_00
MVFMGPGIAAGSQLEFLGTQVDLAPTIMAMAGLAPLPYMDGKSVLPLLVGGYDTAAAHPAIPTDTKRQLHSSRQENGGALPQRLASFHEYYNQGPWEVGSRHPLDDWSNTYIALTYKGPMGYFKYGVYDPYGKQTNFSDPYMLELFDLDKDPFELINIYNTSKQQQPSVVAELHNRLQQFYSCKPGECNKL